MKGLKDIFPKASASFLKANARVLQPVAPQIDVGAEPKRATRGALNATERDFALYLEALKRTGEIQRYEYEGITLRWSGVRYTPDFVVFDTSILDNVPFVRLIEVKGAWISGKFERAVERFRHARTYWDCFAFEMWQKKQGEWRRLY